MGRTARTGQVVWRQAPLMVEEVESRSWRPAMSLNSYCSLRSLAALPDRCPPGAVDACVHRPDEPSRSLGDAAPVSSPVGRSYHVGGPVAGEIQAHLLGRGGAVAAPLPFRNFVAQARLGMSREEHESFFRGMLGDVDEPTAPYGLINAQGDGSGIREARREVDADLASRLRQRARTLGVSAASLCHLAWALVLARVCRDETTWCSGRCFSAACREAKAPTGRRACSSTPCRYGSESAEKSVRESVRQTHTLLAELLRHEHAPLALAQRCSGSRGAHAALQRAPQLSPQRGQRIACPSPPERRARRGKESSSCVAKSGPIIRSA